MSDERHICWCPACDAGWVDAVRIEPLSLKGAICEECEAFWGMEQPIKADEFAQLSALVAQEGSDLASIAIVPLENS